MKVGVNDEKTKKMIWWILYQWRVIKAHHFYAFQIDVNDSVSTKADALSWCDGLLLVYSITDRDSFNFIKKVKQELQSTDTPVLLIGEWNVVENVSFDGKNWVYYYKKEIFVYKASLKHLQIFSTCCFSLTIIIQLGNKADLIHLRQVSTDEGEILAKDFDCKFYEISAAEQVQQVGDAFLDLCREILQVKRKSKQSFIDKIDRMLGGSGRVYSRGKSDSAAISKEWWPIIWQFSTSMISQLTRVNCGGEMATTQLSAFFVCACSEGKFSSETSFYVNCVSLECLIILFVPLLLRNKSFSSFP